MPNRRTTFELTDITEPLLSELELMGFDVRSALNGALTAFTRLNGDDQKQAIAEANGAEITDPAEQAAVHARVCMKIYQSLSTKDFAVSLQFLSDVESRAIREMLKTLHPHPSRPKVKKAKRKEA